MKSTINWAIGGSVFVIAAGIIAYICKFHNYPISDDQAIWGQLGDYLNMFVSTASLILISVLTYVIHDTEMRREEAQKKEDKDHADARDKEEAARSRARDEDEKARDRPILAFMVESEAGGQKFWKIKNISRNVALNPVIAIDHGDGFWTYPVKIYSLGAGEHMILRWFLQVNRICAVYYDVKENVLTSTIQNDRVKIEPDINALDHLAEKNYIRLEDALFQGSIV